MIAIINELIAVTTFFKFTPQTARAEGTWQSQINDQLADIQEALKQNAQTTTTHDSLNMHHKTQMTFENHELQIQVLEHGNPEEKNPVPYRFKQTRKLPTNPHKATWWNTTELTTLILLL